MTEDEAREWVRTNFGSAGAQRLQRLVELVVSENDRQNLIARSTVESIWVRHVVDSLQLLRFADGPGLWIDIGTGGGFPGLAIAAADPARPIMLVEPRSRRTDFLRRAAAILGLTNVEVRQAKIAVVEPHEAAVISARAVAPVGKLLHDAFHCANPRTRWILPRGASAQADAASISSDWKGLFHVEQSLSDSAAGIIVAMSVERR